MPIKVMVVDDHTLFRKGLISILREDSAITIIGEAENGAEFLKQLPSLNPDIVLIDMDMPVLDGLQTIVTMKQQNRFPLSLMISMHNEDKYVLKAIEAGANGYLTKDADPEEIHTAIHSIACNGFYFNDKVNLLMLKNMNQKKKIITKFDASSKILNERDIALITYISEEMTSTEIAEKMFCSPRTVEGMRADLFKKVGVKNIVGLVFFGIKHGIIKLQ